jgi:hypothetical protein
VKYALELNWLDEPGVWKRVRYLEENENFAKAIRAAEAEDELARQKYPQNCPAQFRVTKVET